MRTLRSANRQQLLVFSLGGLACALPLADVQEVTPMVTLSAPPGLSPMLDGFLNLRGRLIPIVGLERLFDFAPTEPDLQTPLLIVSGAAGPVGLRVDSVRDVVTVDTNRTTPIDVGNTFNDCAVGQVSLGELTIHLFSTERLLLERERQMAARLQAEMQSRLDGAGEIPA